MGRPKGSGRGLVAVSLRMEPETYRALYDYAEAHGTSLPEATRLLLRAALVSSGGQLGALTGRALAGSGYNEGLRAGRRDFHLAVQAITAKLWRA